MKNELIRVCYGFFFLFCFGMFVRVCYGGCLPGVNSDEKGHDYFFCVPIFLDVIDISYSLIIISSNESVGQFAFVDTCH